MKTLIDFFLEIILRVKSKNPKIFNVISMLALVLYGLFFASDYLFELNIPEKYMTLLGGIIAGVVAMGQLPVNDDKKSEIEKKLKK